MWNPPDEQERITFQERSFPDQHPDSLMKKMHEHDTTGDMQGSRLYHGLQTNETAKCPMDEVIVIDLSLIHI
eukprot:1798613-Prorocentrum_lima.AAC.1